jgi:hypothetical protein
MWMNSKCCYRFQEELSSAVMQRDPQYVTRAELIKLMEWKLTVNTSRKHFEKIRGM